MDHTPRMHARVEETTRTIPQRSIPSFVVAIRGVLRIRGILAMRGVRGSLGQRGSRGVRGSRPLISLPEIKMQTVFDSRVCGLASTQRGEMANRKPDSGVVQEHRLYISGLHSSVKAKELCERFASFGQVKHGEAGVAELGLDANGQSLSYLSSALAHPFPA